MRNTARHVCNFTIFIMLTIVSRSVVAENVYSGIDLGSTHFSGNGPADTLVFQHGQTFSGRDHSYGLHVGYRITDWLAVELGYMDFGSATRQFKISPNVVYILAQRDTQTLEAKGTGFSVIASHDITSHFSLFGLLGVTNIEYENTLSSGFSNAAGSLFSTTVYLDQGINYGLGIKYIIGDTLSLRTDLRRNDVGDFILDSTTIGIEYSF